MAIETPELRPCPFCGSDDVGFTYLSSGMDMVSCHGCGAETFFNPTAPICELGAHLNAVADAWNRRARQAEVIPVGRGRR